MENCGLTENSEEMMLIESRLKGNPVHLLPQGTNSLLQDETTQIAESSWSSPSSESREASLPHLVPTSASRKVRMKPRWSDSRTQKLL